MTSSHRLKYGVSRELERITNLAIKSVGQYRHADNENDKWRKSHKHWKELDKIINNKEHLKVETLYDRAGDTMGKVIKMFEKYKASLASSTTLKRRVSAKQRL